MKDNEKKREQRREAKRRYRARTRTFGLIYSIEEATQLEAEANRYGFKGVPQYLKASISSLRNSTSYVVPKDTSLRNLILSLRKAGGNINQVVRYAHERHDISPNDIAKLIGQLSEMEASIKEALTLPPNIIDVLNEHLNRYPEDRDKLMTWLNDYQNTTD